VIAATEAAPLRPHEIETIVGRASGNPLFASEIVRAVREVGSLDAVPQSLEAALAAHVDALDPAARRILRCAAVLGRSFSRNALAETLQAAGISFDGTALAQLENFLDADGSERLRFRSGLVRDTTYEGVAYRIRTRLHSAAGAALERLADDPATIADSLALHFSRAGDYDRAWRYAREAADRARRAYANADAARLYELALDASKRIAELDSGDRAKVWTDLGDVRELAGHFDSSLEAYRRALRIVGNDPVARADLLFGRARAKERAGAFTSALRDLTSGTRLIDSDESAAAQTARARLASFAAMVLNAQDRPRRALRQAKLAIQLARAAGDKLSLGRALIVLEMSHLSLEGPGSGSHLKEALALFEDLGDVRMQANVRNNLGVVNAMACRWDEAIEWWKSGREFNLRSGDAVGAAYSGMNTGETLVNQRRFDEAEVPLSDARRVMLASGFREGVAIIEIQIGRTLIERGALQDADELLQRVVDEFKRIGKKFYVLEATVFLAHGRLTAGDPMSALLLLDAAEVAAGNDALIMRPKTAWVRGRILAALGRTDDARRELDAGLESARAQRLLDYEALILRARGELAGGSSTDLAAADQIMIDLGVRETPRSIQAA